MYRHGDVGITRIEQLPKGARQIMSAKSYVVAEGEVTGHCHLVETPGKTGVTVWEFGGERFMVIEGDATITHEEHGLKPVTPGIYRIKIQKEYDPFSARIREVKD